MAAMWRVPTPGSMIPVSFDPGTADAPGPHPVAKRGGIALVLVVE
jgi:hypothetical protein